MSRFTAVQRLGIDIYTPRKPLPVAAPSLFGLHAASPPQTSVPDLPATNPSSVANLLPVLEENAPVARERGERQAARSRAVPASAVRFQLLIATFAQRLVIVSDLKRAPLPAALEASVLQFLQELVFALGPQEVPQPQHAYFQWPLVHKPGLDTGADRAREVLAGFVDSRVRDSAPQYLLLLGEAASNYIQPSGDTLQGTAIPILRGDALGRFFAQPERKAELWRTLGPLCTGA